MDFKRLAEWLETMEGLGKAIAALLVLPAAIWAAITKALDPVVLFLKLPQWVTIVAPVLIITAIGLLLLLSFRRFNRSSRLEQPDAFTLRPSVPGSLVGRTEDLAGLLNSVKNNRIVLLDGESGCGKSALVSAGLIPSLQSLNTLLPIEICDWGDDWLRGPLAAALDALFQSLSQSDRDTLGWASPDLAADAVSLAVDLNTRLKAVVNHLGRRPLLIADQFDDYQAHHRRRFVDDEGNWLSPSSLSKTNLFWDLVSTGLKEGRLHLLVITRADTAAGLACVRFLDGDQTGTRTLPRVESEYLRPLLVGIATDDAQPPIVSNPAGGWHELRERLEIDLKVDRAVLMQQVRTVLLGLRQLPVLTPRSYRSAGGLLGLGTLVISRSIIRAGDAAGGGEAGIRVVRALLARLILAGGPNQPPKAQRILLPDLIEIVGDPPRTDAILKVLQRDEIVRSAEVSDCSIAWQLDHDYLARSVLAEARQADRWAISLRESKVRYEAANSSWWQRLAALLPVSVLARVCWERVRGRLEFGEAASYVRVSMVRPLVALLIVLLIGALAHAWYQYNALTAEANRLISNFGSQHEKSAVLQIWRGPAPLRSRVYDLVSQDNGHDNGQLGRAIKSNWPLAHAGFDRTETQEIAQFLRTRLEQDPISFATAKNYVAVLGRQTDTADIKVEVTALRTLLEHVQDNNTTDILVKAYAARLAGAAEVKAGTTFLRARLRTRLEQKQYHGQVGELLKAYAAVAAQLTDAVDIKNEAVALRTQLEQEQNSGRAYTLVAAYKAVAALLNDVADIKNEAAALRTRLEQKQYNGRVGELLEAYAAVATRLTDVADVKGAAAFLRTRLAQEQEGARIGDILEAYTAVAARMTDAADVKAAVTFLQTRLEQEPQDAYAGDLVNAYAAVAARLTDAADVKAAVTFLQTRMELEQDDEFVNALAKGYAAVIVQLTDTADVRAAATFLRTRLEQEPQDARPFDLVNAYSAVAVRLTDTADVKAAATFLRTRLEQEQKVVSGSYLVNAYAAVAAHLTDATDVKAAATFLRERLKHEPGSGLVEAYAAVTARMTDAADIKNEVAALRKYMDHAHERYGGYILVQTYTAVAERLADGADIKNEAAALRALLEQEQNHAQDYVLVPAYKVVAAKLTDVADVKAATTFLRTQLEQEQDLERAGDLVGAYGAVAAHLTDMADVKAAATFLLTRLVQEQDHSLANALAEGYAAVAGVMAERVKETKDRLALVREILLIAGQPYVDDYAPLLAALKPIASTDFEGSVGAAVNWAKHTYGIKPDELRPPPIER